MAELTTVSGDVLHLDEEDVPILQGLRLYTMRVRKLKYATYVEKTPDGKQRSILAHRAILGAAKGTQIDHIDGDGMNCRRSNLRYSTHAQNQANRRAESDSLSGMKGVSPTPGGNWLARINPGDGAKTNLGVFKDKSDAARAYDRAAIERWGEYARLNFPDEAPVDEAYLRPRRIVTRGASRFRGVAWQEQHQKWLVRFTLNGKTMCPGRFADEEDAAYVYDMTAREAGVPESRLNFPDASVEAVALRAGRALGAARSIARGRTSVYRGVSWYSMGQCWRAAIHVNRKTIIIGNFDGEDDAARAYDIAAVKAWGVEALPRLNFPPTA